ncbi:MAG: hypothetical protein WC408_06165 [Candidatus Micrarchaeia archaeon]|jgi:hypothetical protein
MAVRALVLYFEGDSRLLPVAQSVHQGATIAGAEAALISYSQWSAASYVPDFYDLFFVQVDLAHLFAKRNPLELTKGFEWKGKNVAPFCLCSNSKQSKEAFKKVAADFEARGALVRNTLTLNVKGNLSFLGQGKLEEIDYARAQAFGERTVNYFIGKRISQPSEKAKIAGYRK